MFNESFEKNIHIEAIYSIGAGILTGFDRIGNYEPDRIGRLEGIWPEPDRIPPSQKLTGLSRIFNRIYKIKRRIINL